MIKNRIFLVHRWGGKPNDIWFPWIKRELEKRGFVVKAPRMPDTENPKIKSWVSKLAKTIGQAGENTYFLGHSIGCQTIARYLETLPKNQKVGGVVFVAGFADKLTGLTAEEKLVAKSWLRTPINWKKVKRHARHFVAIHSDNDPYVPLKNAYFFKKELGAEVVIEHKKGHFSEADGVAQFPIALKAILKIAK